MKTSELQQAAISEQTKMFLGCVLKLCDVRESVLKALCRQCGEEKGNSIYWKKFMPGYKALESVVDAFFIESVHYRIDNTNAAEI